MRRLVFASAVVRARRTEIDPKALQPRELNAGETP